jgi:uncharacterized membrane protein YeaQ/YmgE (transglycosylase-associated protein family)
MEWIWFILMLAVVGFIVGGLARLVVPGKDTLGVFGTVMAGLGGSLLGGLIGQALFGPLEWWAGLLFAVGGAALLVIPFSMRSTRRPIAH